MLFLNDFPSEEAKIGMIRPNDKESAVFSRSIRVGEEGWAKKRVGAPGSAHPFMPKIDLATEQL